LHFDSRFGSVPVFHIATGRRQERFGTGRKIGRTAGRNQRQTHDLFDLAKTLTATLSLSAILDLLAVNSLRIVDAESASALLREDYGFLSDTLFRGQFPEKKKLRLQSDAGIPGWVLLNRSTYLNNRAGSDPLIPPELRAPIPIRSIVCAPVFDVNSNIMALLVLYNKRGGPFSRRDVESLEGIAQVASIALQNALTYRRAQQAEDNLRRLSSCLIKSQDDERRRISRELHETTAQDLAALRMCLGRVTRSASRLTLLSRDALRESLDISNKLISSVRTLSYLLHPPGLEEAGLEAAFQWYASGFSKRSGISVNVNLQDGLGRLPSEYETTLFRIMQECLTNIHNHSGCRKASIRLAQDKGHISMEVHDDGRGIPGCTDRFTSSDPRIGVGIAGMRERVQQFHGDLRVSGAPGRGTTVRVLIPIPKGRPHKNAQRNNLNDSAYDRLLASSPAVTS
jgi:signal transduction histidine kinase